MPLEGPDQTARARCARLHRARHVRGGKRRTGGNRPISPASSGRFDRARCHLSGPQEMGPDGGRRAKAGRVESERARTLYRPGLRHKARGIRADGARDPDPEEQSWHSTYTLNRSGLGRRQGPNLTGRPACRRNTPGD